VQPRVVRDVFLGDDHSPEPPALGRRVLSPETADEMRQMLEGVVEHGTGTNAQLPGYTSAGKTGTAQKVGPNGTYSHKDYIASFIGFAPATHPAVTILVVIDTPVGAIYGAEVAAPVFRTIAEQTLGYLNIPQDNPSWWPQVASSAPAGFLRQQRRSPAGRPPLEPEPTGAASSPVQNVAYRFVSPDPAPPTVMLDEGPLVRVPDFSGQALRSVVEECQQLGLDLSLSGSGLAVEQNPLPGRQVPAGARVWVRFAR
jgi:membrane peptidoglycan carboxypeptidase